MPIVIEGKYGIGFRQSPYLYNNFGFKAIVAEGNTIEGVEAKSKYVEFFEKEIYHYKLRKIEEYSKLIPYELKATIEDMPKDETDWALIMYFMCCNKANIVTLGKISTYFRLPKEQVQERLNRMVWFVEQYVCWDDFDRPTYYKYNMTDYGREIIQSLMNAFYKPFEKMFEKERKQNAKRR